VTDNEIQILFVGIALGAQGVSLLHAFWNVRDTRRGQVAAEAARKSTAGDLYLNGFRLYRLQHRSPA
jgi:hypothetical protein